ncbi:MAG: hypothetical protein KJO98_11375, partial [Rhodothermia bacterium]|nr:hypothetical protein [Rhodothermia bacterium]
MPGIRASRSAVSAENAVFPLFTTTKRAKCVRAERIGVLLITAMVATLATTTVTSAQAQTPQITTSATEGVFENKVVVSWTAENIPAGAFFVITREDAANCLSGNFQAQDTLAVRSRVDTEYSDFTGDPGVFYCYGVSATVPPDSTVAGDYAAGRRVIFKPTNLRATLGTEEDRVLVSWRDRSEVESRYEIGRVEEDGFFVGAPPTLLATLPENSGAYSDTTAVPGTRYVYCVTAFDAAGFASNEVCEVGLRGFVTPPRNVSASDGQWPNFVRVTWTDDSKVESFFTVYRGDFEGNAQPLGNVPADSTLFEDVTAEAGFNYTYCVTSTADGMESVRACDNGVRGVLPSPANVTATVDTFDDRVVVNWDDVTDTEDGFQIFRALPAATDSVLLGSVRASVQTFTDRTPLQDQDYRYCVRAFSTVASPDTTYSPGVCAPGRRTTVLAPTNVAATDDQFEERINAAWSNPASTAMFFNVYRDGVLIDNVPTVTPFFTDFDAPSNVGLNYCVTAVS